MNQIRVFADANFRRAILSGILQRVENVDIETAQDAGLETASDAEILEYAATHNRILRKVISRGNRYPSISGRRTRD
jgi:predicted nuclease of predicted toxin-antitoxin system